MTGNRGARRPAVALLLVSLLLACADGAEPDTISVGNESVPVSRLREAAAGLCTARHQAGAGDVNTARATFYDRSHDALHTLARALEPADRALAARLLEAKQRVESDLAGGTPPTDLAADLDRLSEVTGAGLVRLSIDPPPCA